MWYCPGSDKYARPIDGSPMATVVLGAWGKIRELRKRADATYATVVFLDGDRISRRARLRTASIALSRAIERIASNAPQEDQNENLGAKAEASGGPANVHTNEPVQEPKTDAGPIDRAPSAGSAPRLSRDESIGGARQSGVPPTKPIRRPPNDIGSNTMHVSPSMTPFQDQAQTQTARGFEYTVKVLRRHWMLILACLVITTAAAFALSKTQKKQYTATASLLFTNTSVAQEASGITAVNTNDPTGQRNTNLALVQLAENVPQRVASKIGMGLTANEVKSAVAAAQSGQSNIVSVSATWRTPAVAARIANTFAGQFIAQQGDNDRRTIQNAIHLVQQQYAALSKAQRLAGQGQSLLDHIESLKILEAMQSSTQLAKVATVPQSPSSPKVKRNTILGLFLGLVLGLGLAFMFERFDRRIREADEVAELFGLPMLGVIPHSRSGGRTASELGEPIRMLRARLRYFNVDRELKALLITSARPAEGKTTIAYSLAAAAASLGTRTLLVEADLRKPTLAQSVALDSQLGLSGALVGAGNVEDAIQQVEVDAPASTNGGKRTLEVLPAGISPPNPTELLESHAMEHLLAWARDNYEFIVIDTPPLSLVADAIPLMKSVDGLIIVSRLGLTTRDDPERLRKLLEGLGAPALGIVVNDVQTSRGGYYGYGHDGRAPRPEPRAASRDRERVESTRV